VHPRNPPLVTLAVALLGVAWFGASSAHCNAGRGRAPRRAPDAVPTAAPPPPSPAAADGGDSGDAAGAAHAPDPTRPPPTASEPSPLHARPTDGRAPAVDTGDTGRPERRAVFPADDAGVRAAVLSVASEAKGCYDDQLLKHPNLTVRLVVGFRADPPDTGASSDGPWPVRVTSLVHGPARDGTPPMRFDSADFERCIHDTFEQILFESHPEGAPVEAEVPMSFLSASD